MNAQHVRAIKTGELAIQAGLQRMSLRYANPFLDIDDTGQTTSLTLDTHYKWKGNEHTAIKIGLDNAIRKAAHPNLSDSAQELQTSLYFSGELGLSDLVLLPSMRVDRYALPESDAVTAVSPHIGATLNPSLMPAFYVKLKLESLFDRQRLMIGIGSLVAMLSSNLKSVGDTKRG